MIFIEILHFTPMCTYKISKYILLVKVVWLAILSLEALFVILHVGTSSCTYTSIYVNSYTYQLLR